MYYNAALTVMQVAALWVGLGDIKIYLRRLLPEKLMQLLHYRCIVSQVSLYTCLSPKFPILVSPLIIVCEKFVCFVSLVVPILLETM